MVARLLTMLLALGGDHDQGSTLDEKINSSPPSLLPKLEVLLQTKHFAVIDKPALVPCHIYVPPSTSRRRRKQSHKELVEDTIVRRAYQTFPNAESIHMVNRLDVPTSGCLMIAFSSVAAQALQQGLLGRYTVTKTYYAICRGNGQVLRQRGVVFADDNVKNSKGVYKSARTEIACICGSDNVDGDVPRCCLVKAKLSTTGRWHQIRQHLGKLSHPIVMENLHHADKRYKKEWKTVFEANKEVFKHHQPRLCLHCHRIQVESTEENGMVETNPFLPPEGLDVSCQIPMDLQSIIDLTDWSDEARSLVPELFH